MNNRNPNIDVLEKNFKWIWVKSKTGEAVFLNETKTYVLIDENKAQNIPFTVDITKRMAEEGIPFRVPKCPFIKRYVDEELLEYVSEEKAKKLADKWIKKRQKEIEEEKAAKEAAENPVKETDQETITDGKK